MKIKSRASFILTALGAAMGLGNCLRFPGLCASYGGGAFIAAYAVALIAIGLPLMCAELSFGRRRREPFAQSLGNLNKRASFIGWAACANSAFAAFQYSAVIAWILRMVFEIAPLCLSGQGAEEAFFGDILHSSDCFPAHVCPTVLALIAVVWVVLFAVLKGGNRALSRTAKYTVVIPAALFALMAARGLFYENSLAALSALFIPDAAKFSDLNLWSNAFSQAVFSLSLAAGVMPSFGRAMPEESGVLGSAVTVTAANFLGCLLSSIAFFTAVYGCGLQGAVTRSGIITAFSLYPAVLVKMFPNPVVSAIFGVVFYLSIGLTALQSALSLLQALVYPLADGLNTTLAHAAAYICVVGAVFALPFATGLGKMLIDISDRFANGLNTLIIGACECLVFAKLRPPEVYGAVNGKGGRVYAACIKFVCPAVLSCLALYAVADLILSGGRYNINYPLTAEIIFGWAASAAVFASGKIIGRVRLLTKRRKCDKI